jgi:hypothetical protein
MIDKLKNRIKETSSINGSYLCVGELQARDGEHDLCGRHHDELRQQPHDVHRVLVRDLMSDEILKNVFNLVKTILMFDLFFYYLSLLQEFKEKSRDRV